MSAVQNKFHKTLVLVATVIALGAVTGCHKKASGVDPNALVQPPPLLPLPHRHHHCGFRAIDLGQSVVLNWRSQNASAVSIDGIGDVNLNGTRPSRPPTPPTSISSPRETAALPKPTSALPSECLSLHRACCHRGYGQ